MTAPRASALPERMRLKLAPTVRRYDGGRVLADRRSGRMVRLSAAGVRALEDLLAGRVVPDGARALGRRLEDAGIAHPRVTDGGEPPPLTVVIPVRDRPVELARLLSAIGRTHPVTVVDDGSVDGATVAVICAEHDARLLVRTTSGGPAAARNTGLAAVTTELVAFIDSDCTPPRGWIERLVPQFADPTLGAVAPRIAPRGRGATLAQRYANARCPLDLGPEEGLVAPGRPLAYVPTATIVVRRAALADGFHAGLRYGEDVDAVWRMHDAGWRVRYDPAVVVEHDEPATWRGLLTRRRHYGSSAAPLSSRHRGRLAPFVLHPWPAATLVAALAGRPRLVLGLSAISACRTARTATRVGVPAATVAAWSLRGTWRSLVVMARAATTLAGPLIAAAAIADRRARLPVACLLVVPPLVDWAERRPPLNPVVWAGASIADDVAYGAGVWAGCLRLRTLDPLIPRLAQPGSRRAPGSRSSVATVGLDTAAALVGRWRRRRAEHRLDGRRDRPRAGRVRRGARS